MRDEKLPSMQYYPNDWRSDAGVQSLDYFTRGVWHEILCIMHVSDTRGRLTLNNKKMPIEALAMALGLSIQITESAVNKILEYGVASQDQDGVVYCRRMVRDEHARQQHRAAGAFGGNPNFKTGQRNPYYNAQKENSKKITPPITSHKRKITKNITKEITKFIDGKDNLTHNQTDNQKITLSSSSSSSTSTPNGSAEKISAGAPTPYPELLAAYNQHRGALPEAKALTKGRMQKMIVRWKENPDIGYWTEVFKKSGRSQMMVKWASFNWIVENSENHVKIAEGNYDNSRESRAAPQIMPAPYKPLPVPSEHDLPDAEFLRKAKAKAGLV